MNTHSRLLINQSPLLVLPDLAKTLGLNEAIFLQQLHFWMSVQKVGKVHDGRKWVRNTMDEWLENFPFWSKRTLERIVAGLEESGVLTSTSDFNKYHKDRTKWYTIDYDLLDSLIDQSANVTDSHSAKMADSHSAKVAGPLPETTTETTKKEILSPGSERPIPETDKRKSSDLDRIKTELFEFFVAETAFAKFAVPKEGPGRAKTCYQPLLEMYSSYQPEYEAADGSPSTKKYNYNRAAIEKVKSLISNAVKYNRQNGLAIKNVLSIVHAANAVATNGVVTRDTLREIKLALRRFRDPQQARQEISGTSWKVVERMNVDWSQMGNMTEFEINRLFTQVTGVA